MRLRSEDLQRRYEEEGAVVIPNFISQDKLAVIQEFFEELKITELDKIHSNMLDPIPEFNERFRNKCVELFKDSIHENFTDYKIAGGAFLLKGLGENSLSSLHQDWNIVDESKYQSASIFCPVEDVTLENGCLQIIKGSHKWFNNVRSITIPSVFLSFNQVSKGLKALPVKAGEVVLFNHRVFHGSKANNSNKIRVAVAVGVTSKDADYIHYQREKDEVNIIEANEQFSYHGIAKLFKGEKFNYKVLGKKQFSELEVTDFDKFEKAYKQFYPPNFKDKISNLFKR